MRQAPVPLPFSPMLTRARRLPWSPPPRGSKGALGSGGLVLNREDLPAVRVEEQRAVGQMLGVRKIVYLGYIDGEVKDVPRTDITKRLASIFTAVQPQVMIPHGPCAIITWTTWPCLPRPRRLSWTISGSSRQAACRARCPASSMSLCRSSWSRSSALTWTAWRLSRTPPSMATPTGR